MTNPSDSEVPNAPQPGGTPDSSAPAAAIIGAAGVLPGAPVSPPADPGTPGGSDVQEPALASQGHPAPQNAGQNAGPQDAGQDAQAQNAQATNAQATNAQAPYAQPLDGSSARTGVPGTPASSSVPAHSAPGGTVPGAIATQPVNGETAPPSAEPAQPASGITRTSAYSAAPSPAAPSPATPDPQAPTSESHSSPEAPSPETPVPGTAAQPAAPSPAATDSSPAPDAAAGQAEALTRSLESYAPVATTAQLNRGDTEPQPDATPAQAVHEPVPVADDVLAERARRYSNTAETTPTVVADPLPDEEYDPPVAFTPPSAVQAQPAAEVATPANAGSEDSQIDPDELPEPRSRAAAHLWSVLLTLVFAPISWFLLSDGGVRLSTSLEAGSPNLAGYLEVGGGILAAMLVLFAARWSSLGATIIGIITTLLGGAYFGFRDQVHQWVDNNEELIGRFGGLGQNVVDAAIREAQSGRLVIYGITLIMVAVVSHGARRQGRREEKRRAILED